MAAREETKPLRVAAILIGSLGDVAPFADLFSRLPRVEPTIFCLDEAVDYVEKRGMAAVGLFSIETWKENETTLDGATLTGMDFVKAWIRHMLAPATLDDCVAKIREHHEARPFDALLYQTQAFPVVFFCAGDLRARGRRPGLARVATAASQVPFVKIEVTESVPNLIRNPSVDCASVGGGVPRETFFDRRRRRAP